MSFNLVEFYSSWTNLLHTVRQYLTYIYILYQLGPALH